MTLIRCLIPTPLRPTVNNQSEIELTLDGSLYDVLHDLIKTYSSLKKYLLDDQGQFRGYINYYINDKDIRDLNSFDTLLSDGDTLSIVPAIAGGFL